MNQEQAARNLRQATMEASLGNQQLSLSNQVQRITNLQDAAMAPSPGKQEVHPSNQEHPPHNPGTTYREHEMNPGNQGLNPGKY